MSGVASRRTGAGRFAAIRSILGRKPRTTRVLAATINGLFEAMRVREMKPDNDGYDTRQHAQAEY